MTSPYLVTLIGLPSSGKSSIINALLNKRVLQSGLCRTTTDCKLLDDIVTDDDNNKFKVLDLPGICDSEEKSNNFTEMTITNIANANLIFWVSDANKAFITTHEVEEYKKIKEYLKNLTFNTGKIYDLGIILSKCNTFDSNFDNKNNGKNIVDANGEICDMEEDTNIMDMIRKVYEKFPNENIMLFNAFGRVIYNYASSQNFKSFVAKVGGAISEHNTRFVISKYCKNIVERQENEYCAFFERNYDYYLKNKINLDKFMDCFSKLNEQNKVKYILQYISTNDYKSYCLFHFLNEIIKKYNYIYTQNNNIISDCMIKYLINVLNQMRTDINDVYSQFKFHFQNISKQNQIDIFTDMIINNKFNLNDIHIKNLYNTLYDVYMQNDIIPLEEKYKTLLEYDFGILSKNGKKYQNDDTLNYFIKMDQYKKQLEELDDLNKRSLLYEKKIIYIKDLIDLYKKNKFFFGYNDIIQEFFTILQDYIKIGKKIIPDISYINDLTKKFSSICHGIQSNYNYYILSYDSRENDIGITYYKKFSDIWYSESVSKISFHKFYTNIIEEIEKIYLEKNKKKYKDEREFENENFHKFINEKFSKLTFELQEEIIDNIIFTNKYELSNNDRILFLNNNFEQTGRFDKYNFRLKFNNFIIKTENAKDFNIMSDMMLEYCKSIIDKYEFEFEFEFDFDFDTSEIKELNYCQKCKEHRLEKFSRNANAIFNNNMCAIHNIPLTEYTKKNKTYNEIQQNIEKCFSLYQNLYEEEKYLIFNKLMLLKKIYNNINSNNFDFYERFAQNSKHEIIYNTHRYKEMQTNFVKKIVSNPLLYRDNFPFIILHKEELLFY
jgi:hypothetical protein